MHVGRAGGVGIILVELEIVFWLRIMCVKFLMEICERVSMSL